MSGFPLRSNSMPHGLRPTLASTLFATIASALIATAAPDAAAAGDNPQVLMKTSLGEIVIELYPQKAPKTVANFLQYVDDGFYADTIFHRVIPSFMIQGGGMKKDMSRKDTRAAIPLESQNGLKNDKGTIAMARTNVPDSATSQFFINTNDNDNLNYPKPDGNGYTVFGKVVKGQETVDKIAAVQTGRQGMHGDVPAQTVTIQSVSRVAN